MEHFYKAEARQTLIASSDIAHLPCRGLALAAGAKLVSDISGLTAEASTMKNKVTSVSITV